MKRFERIRGLTVLSGLILGAAYGLVMRYVFEHEAVDGYIEIVSNSFLIVAPFAVGAISVFIAWKGGPMSWSSQVYVACITMLLFLASMFALFIEGLICLVLVLPVFLLMAIAGSLTMGGVLHYTKYGRSTLNGLVLLPLLLAPVESLYQPEGETRAVRTQRVIQASPSEIWQRIVSVENISRDELDFSFTHVMGVPYPVQAEMTGEGVGALRTSTWEKGVSFGERITAWEPPNRLFYEFEIDSDSIPRDALDRHVEMGGKYFTVTYGGYSIRELEPGVSEVTLQTTYQNLSRLKLYGNIWGDFVLDDFHRVILKLIESRTLGGE